MPPAQPDPPTPEASPEAIVVEDESPQLQLSLTDLGLSQAWNKEMKCFFFVIIS